MECNKGAQVLEDEFLVSKLRSFFPAPIEAVGRVDAESWPGKLKLPPLVQGGKRLAVPP